MHPPLVITSPPDASPAGDNASSPSHTPPRGNAPASNNAPSLGETPTPAPDDAASSDDSPPPTDASAQDAASSDDGPRSADSSAQDANSLLHSTLALDSHSSPGAGPAPRGSGAPTPTSALPRNNSPSSETRLHLGSSSQPHGPTQDDNKTDPSDDTPPATQDQFVNITGSTMGLA